MKASSFCPPSGGPLLIGLGCLSLVVSLAADASRRHTPDPFDDDGSVLRLGGNNNSSQQQASLYIYQNGSEDARAGESCEEDPARALEVGRRMKRQLSTLARCPNGPKALPSNAKPKVILYSIYTRDDLELTQGRNGWQRSDIRALIEGGFDTNRDTLLYSHGYLQNSKTQYLSSIRRAYDKLYPPGSVDTPERFNLLMYDWGDFSVGTYGSVASQVPALARVLSDFLKQLSESYNLRRVTFVSYSLSTHMSGLTGRHLKESGKTLGKISALDPTGVCFHQNHPFANEYRLRVDDAEQVVAKHYDWGFFGASRYIGGVDIRVNGGTNQPEMDMNFDIRRYISGSVSDHNRAAFHEASLPLADCQEVAYACSSYEKFLAGQCGDCGKSGNKCYLMNNFALNNLKNKLDNPRVEYAPNTVMHITTGKRQFCVHHYQIVLRLKDNTPASVRKLVRSQRFSVELPGGKQVAPHNALDSNIYTELLRSETKLPRLGNNLDINAKKELVMAIKYFDVKYMSNIFSKERGIYSGRFCPASDGLSLVRCKTSGDSRKKNRVGSRQYYNKPAPSDQLDNSAYYSSNNNNDQFWPFNWRNFW